MLIKKIRVFMFLIVLLLVIMNSNSTAEQITYAPYDGVAWFLNEENGKLGLTDMAGNVIIHPSFDGASPFINNLAVIENDQLYGGRYHRKAGAWCAKPEHPEEGREEVS